MLINNFEFNPTNYLNHAQNNLESAQSQLMDSVGKNKALPVMQAANNYNQAKMQVSLALLFLKETFQRDKEVLKLLATA